MRGLSDGIARHCDGIPSIKQHRILRAFIPRYHDHAPRPDSRKRQHDVQSDSDWGGIENLIVPQTKSQAEKDAEAKAQQEEETRKQAQEQAVRQAQTRAAQKEEVNRSAERTAITPPASKTGQAVAEYAMQFSGYPYVYGGNQPSGWDCSGFVQYVVRAIRCQSPPPVRQSNERRFARGIIGRSPTGRYSRQRFARRHLHRQRHGHERHESKPRHWSRTGQHGHVRRVRNQTNRLKNSSLSYFLVFLLFRRKNTLSWKTKTLQK